MDENYYPQEICIDLWNICCGEHRTNFTTKLLELLAKADRVNYQKIATGWPAVVRVWERWHDHEDGAAWLIEQFRTPPKP